MKKLKFKHRLKIYKWITAILLVFVLVVTCYAVTMKEANFTNSRFDLEHDALAIVAAIIGYLVVRTITKVDKSVDLLFQKNDKRKEEHDTLRSEFDVVKGQHELNMSNCKAGK